MSLEQSREVEAVIKGIIGETIGQSPLEQKSRLESASKGATDLSAFVRRKPAAKRSAERENQEGDDKKRTRLDDSASGS